MLVLTIVLLVVLIGSFELFSIIVTNTVQALSLVFYEAVVLPLLPVKYY
jgi:hypothetical protein